MRRTPPPRPGTRALAASAVVAALLLSLAACDSGSAKPRSARSTTSSTKPRAHRGSTTTTSAPPSGSTSTSPTTLPPTTVPPTPTTTLPPNSGGTCGGATGPITDAVVSGDLGPVPVSSYDVTDCRRSASQPIWAAVTLTPKAGQNVARQTVALELLGSIWIVHSYGTGATGCDIPAPVPAELRLGC